MLNIYTLKKYTTNKMGSHGVFTSLPVSALYVSKLNVRHKLMDDKEETTIDMLAENIKQNGLLNPLIVIPDKKGKYEIIAGQRRFLALKRLDAQEVQCKKLETCDTTNAQVLSLSENVQRNKMCQQDKLEAFYKLYTTYDKSLSKLAATINYSPYTLKNYILVFEQLHQNLFKNLDEYGDEKLSMDIAVLLAKHIPKPDQEKVFDKIKSLGTTNLKRQAILELSNHSGNDQDEEDMNDSNDQDMDDNHDKEHHSDGEKKKKIPKDPWIFDENNEPMLIPKELYFHVLQFIRQNS